MKLGTQLTKGAVYIALIAASGATTLGVYQYHQTNAALNQRIDNLQTQVESLKTALENSNTVAEATKKQIQEIAKKPYPTPQAAVSPATPESALPIVVAKASPAVVSVVVSEDISTFNIEYTPSSDSSGIALPVYKEVTQMKKVGAGSGFIVNKNGYIVTNMHVVSNPEAKYTITLSSGDKKTAEVVFKDKDQDIAILKIPGTNYPTIPLGDSSKLKAGQTVAAIGNALGEYSNSVSVGIVSGLNRTIEARSSQDTTETLTGVIQTDAAINLGNSGGPLLDLNGNAVGINVALEQGANNIAFAIPINSVKSLINQVIP